jgi:malonyl CoA-acyl carrier protein transacylase/protein-L-isoaspartate O-methyltransferase
MAQGLYRAEPIVKNAIDECCRLLKPDLGLDLRRILFPAERRRTSAAAKLRDTALAQPALFVVEYAIAQLWRSWGIEPTAMIGHSIGEYVAATLAGVMAVEDALRLIASRGRLISALPSGSMLAVVAPTDAVDKFLDDDVCLAAVNAPSLCVLSGSHTAIERVERALATKSIAAHRLHTSHAFHSSMMEPMLAEFGSQVADTPFAAPTIPYVATLTGAWADGDARQPDYWTSQIRSPVRFADGISALTDAGGPVGGDAVFVEVGPGRTLVTFAARCNDAISPTRLVTSLPAAEDPTPDTEVISSSLGRLWESGITVDWKGFHVTERRYRVSLPTYPFERQSYWIGRANRPSAEPPAEPRDPADWFFEPLWRETAIPDTETGKLTGSPVLVFDDRAGMGSAVADALSAVGALPIMVRRGDRFECVSDDDYRLDPAQEAGFSELAAAVCARHQLAGVVNCWGAEPPSEVEVTDAALTTFLTPLRLAVALGSHTTARPLPILLVARGTASVLDGDMLDPPRSFGIGAAKVLPQEQAGLRLSHIDVDDMTSAPSLIAELALQAPESQVAYRQGRRFVYAYEPRPIAESRPPAGVPSNPVVMVTGGLGYMGLILAEAAFFGLGARLVLMGRTQLPPPQEWAATSEDLTVPEAQRTLLRRLAVMRAERDDVMVTRTDLADVAQVRTAVDAAVERFGRVDIVVHGAANVGPAAFGSTADTDDSVVAAQISPKITGLLNLIEAMRGREPGRWIVHGSISAILGGLGLAAYAGANAVLNTMVEKGRRSGRDWLSIEWDAWDNAGESQALALQTAVIRPQEGQEAFLRILGTSACPRIVVAANDLEGRIESWIRLVKVPGSSDGGKHPRPNLSTAYIEPRTETERELAEIWSAQLGVENVGVHDRFFDLGGHSLLAVQVSAEIRDHFGVEMPVLQLFKAPTISELAPLVENPSGDASLPGTEARRDAEVKQDMPAVVERDGDSGAAAKVSYQQFYDDITRRLEATGMGEASFFLNYGYVSLDDADEAQFAVSDEAFNANSIRLAYELIGHTELAAKSVVDVGCGRGGTAALLAERFGAAVTGVDLSPEAIAFCRKTHIHPTLHFTTGDAEHLPTDDNSCDVVTNIESSHTYPDMRAFLAEVGRVLRPSGMFLHTDLLPVQRWLEVRAILQAQGFVVESERDITANVLASCDDVAGSRTVAFGEQNTMIDNFLAVPGSPVYEQMRSGAWEYRILRSRLTS